LYKLLHREDDAPISSHLPYQLANKFIFSRQYFILIQKFTAEKRIYIVIVEASAFKRYFSKQILAAGEAQASVCLLNVNQVNAIASEILDD
jgi:hypothetical protein